MSVGVLCSLTQRKPDFQGSCRDFVVDPVEEHKQAAKEYVADLDREERAEGNFIPMRKKSGGMSAWSVIVIIAIIARIVMRLMRD